MAFWIALVYRGARVGGLRESRNCSLEGEVPYFPRDVPDTRAGVQHSEETGKESENKYARYPPNKRPSYTKLGIVSPFKISWGQLVKEWKSKAGSLVPTSQENSQIKSVLSRTATEYSAVVDNSSVTIDSDSLREDAVDSNCLPKKSVKNECDNSVSSENDSGLENRISDSESFYVLRDIFKLRDLRGRVTQEQRNRKRLTDDERDLNPVYEIMKNNLDRLLHDQ